MHHYMKYAERLRLEAWLLDHVPVSEIARRLGFSRQTIYNEINTGSYLHDCYHYEERRYSADRAELIHSMRQSAKGRPDKIGSHYDYALYLEQKIIQDKFSPAAALAAAKCQGFSVCVCTATLYRYIDTGLFSSLSNKHLLYKSQRRKRGRPMQRIAHPRLPSIVDRPDHIGSRSDLGHWEMDLVVGKSGSRPVLLTLTERLSRFELIFKLPNRKASTVRSVFDKLEKKCPDFRTVFKSITTDNGSEFLQYQQLRQSIFGGNRFDIYYCHSFSAWEKGSNENHNRMIRRFFPKGTDFSRISKRRIFEVQSWMNRYPRRLHNWSCPADLFPFSVPSF